MFAGGGYLFIYLYLFFCTFLCLQSEKLALMESMKQELEEKIRKLEEDKQNMDISAGKIFNFYYEKLRFWQEKYFESQIRCYSPTSLTF